MACSKSWSASVEKKARGHSGARERFERRVVKDRKENRVTRMTQTRVTISNLVRGRKGFDSTSFQLCIEVGEFKKGRIK